MAIGGVETPQSTGRPYIPVEDAVRAGAGDATAEMQGIIDADEGLPPLMSEDTAGFDDPNFDTTTTGAPPIIPAPPNPTGDPATAPGVDIGPQPRRGSGRGFKIGYDGPQIDPDRQFTNRDYYGTNPRIAGSMGGREMYMPSFGEVPMGVLASQLQAKQAERAALAKKREAFRLDAGLNETAPQFQQEFTKYAGASLANFEDAVIAQFDSNRSKALDHLVNTQEGQRAWQRKVAELNAVGTEVKHVAEQASKFVDEYGKGLIRQTPENQRVYEESQRVVAGYGSLGTDGEVDLNQLIKNSRVLDKTMSRNEFVNKFVKPDIEKSLKTWESEGKVRMVNGKLVMDQVTKKTYEGAMRRYAEDMTRMGLFDHVLDDGVPYLMDVFPDSQTMDSKVYDPYESVERKERAKGGGKDTGAWFGKLERGVSSTMMESLTGPAIDPEDIFKGKTTSEKLRKSTVNRLPIGEIVSDRKQNMGPRKFTDANGKPVEMNPQYIEQDVEGGEMYVVGRPIAEEDTDTRTTDIVAETPLGADVKKKVTDRFVNKPQREWVRVPVSHNESAIDEYMGGSEWREAFPDIKPRKMSYLETDPAPPKKKKLY